MLLFLASKLTRVKIMQLIRYILGSRIQVIYEAYEAGLESDAWVLAT